MASNVSLSAVTWNTISPLISSELIVRSCVVLLLLVSKTLPTLSSANTASGFANVNNSTLAVATFDIFFI